MRSTRRALTLLVLLGVLAPLGLLGGASTGAPQPSPRLGETIRPLIDFRGAADPTVVLYGNQYVALSTGPNAPRAVAPTLNGPWTDAGNALLTLPPWALNNKIWASDLVQVDNTWVLYFSAPVAGLAGDGRCIGAATAASPLDQFVPQERPLVCPRGAVADQGYDIARPRAKGLPKRQGVIDPEGYQDRDGTRYVLYRTQGRPSSLRMVEVPRSGLASLRGRDSIELLRRRGVVENPVLVRRGSHWVLLTSQSYFGSCGYETTWRKAGKLAGLARARKHVLLDQARTGLCGPGGADLLGPSTVAPDTLVLHSWTCPEQRFHCQSGIDYDRTPSYGSHRAMFAADLAWSTKGVPSITGWVAPTVDPWAPPPA